MVGAKNTTTTARGLCAAKYSAHNCVTRTKFSKISIKALYRPFILHRKAARAVSLPISVNLNAV